MQLKFKLKPYSKYTGKGTKKDALYRLENNLGLSPVANCFSTYGDFQHRWGDRDNAWLYTIQVYKRGKHRKNKTYHIWVYRVPIKLLEILRIRMIQKRNGIKIEKM